MGVPPAAVVATGKRIEALQGVCSGSHFQFVAGRISGPAVINVSAGETTQATKAAPLVTARKRPPEGDPVAHMFIVCLILGRLGLEATR